MTVLYLKDWRDSKGNPKAIVDSSTKNRSFVVMCERLKLMGIRNHQFPLSLYDTDLKGINPHELTEANDPSGDMRAKVTAESKRNFWYWLREVARIPPAGGDPMPVRLDRGGLAMAWSYMNSIKYIGIQPRQTGKAQPLDAKIKVPGGWTTMGDIRVGSVVTAADGTPSKVIGVYPQGRKEIYRIVFEDGRSTKCCADHLWKVKTKDIEWGTYSLKTIMQSEDEWFIPFMSPEDMIDIELPVDHEEIVEKLKETSPKQKRAYLKTLLSVEGELDSHYNFYTSDRKKASDIRYIVRSLGGYCLLKTETFQMGTCLYTLDISFDRDALKIVSIHKVSTEHAQCIEIDHPSHLYVTDDYIVTHNTTMALLITTWLFCVAGQNITIGMMAHEDKLRGQNVARIKDFRALLPKYMVHNTIKNTNNAQNMKYHSLNNSYISAVATSERGKAHLVLRGLALALVHGDEPAFCANMDKTFPSLIASGSTAMEQAFENGLPCGFILTTTAGDPRTVSGKWAMELVQEAVNYAEKILDLPNREALVEFVDKNSESGFVNGTFSHLQLGKTNAWLMERLKSAKGNLDAIQRDWLNRWNTVIGETILSKETVKRISASLRSSPSFYEIREGFAISWYVGEAERIAYRNKPIILGMDTSDMINRDSTAFVGIDPNTFEVVMTFACNEANLVKFTDFVVNLLIDYKRLILVPESKSSARGILDKVGKVLYARGENPFYRIFNTVVQEMGNPKYSNIDINDPRIMDTEHRKLLGFMTGGKTRDILYKSVLQQATSIAADMIYDPKLIAEITSLEVRNGRIDHKAGSHDDMVMSFMLACYLLLEGQNLSYYGLSEGARSHYISNAHTKKEVGEQIEIHKQIEQVRKKISETYDPFQRNIYSMQLRTLEGRIDSSVQLDPLTLDAIKGKVTLQNNKPKSSIEDALNNWQSAGLLGKRYG